jgi:hypothetical protein
LVTERTTNRGGQIATRRTVRKVRPSGQWLKIMEEALHAIDRISAELGPEVAPSRIYEQLYAMRSEFLAFHADEMDQSADGECPTTTGEAEQERRDADSEAGVPA